MKDIKYCRRCGRCFDIGTNFSLCPDCRNIKNKEEFKRLIDGRENKKN